jgi:hypothetical protein
LKKEIACKTFNFSLSIVFKLDKYQTNHSWLLIATSYICPWQPNDFIYQCCWVYLWLANNTADASKPGNEPVHYIALAATTTTTMHTHKKKKPID